MTISMRRLVPAALALPLVLAGEPARAADARAEFGVYEYVLERAGGTVADAGGALESALSSSGWRLLAKVDAGVPQGCRYKARVFAVVDPEYAKELMAINRRTAPFAVVDRINVFEDEGGVHVAVLNAESVNRTVLMDDATHANLSRAHLEKLRALVTRAVPGKVSDREFGEKRSRGHIGKTMGVMAGGPFAEKVEEEAGSTGSPMDSKSFSIVGAGADDARGSFQCPGLAHAAAYPLEVVVTREGDAVKVRLVDVMYRMKMYFEDAGKWAFMKNMGMPGSIHDELAAQIRSGLELP